VRTRFSVWSLLGIAAVFLGTRQPALAAELSDTEIADLSLQVFVSHGAERREAIEALLAGGDDSLIPTFVFAMRKTGNDAHVRDALERLTGEAFDTWHDAYDWQEAHPEVKPHESFRPLKLKFVANTDARFGDFFSGPNTARDEMKIRFEEIVWGGVLVDGIPPLDMPEMIKAAEASYLADDDLVFGVELNGDARAYPLRIMGWHEMMNDTVGGVPLALAYCTLCAAWRKAHPDTTVLSQETGWVRDYGSGVTYREYFASPDLMFPARIGDERHARRKDYVFGIRGFAAAKAWPIEAFQDEPVINDRVGSRAVVLIGDAETRTVRAYERGEEIFEALGPDSVESASGRWRVNEDFLTSEAGKRLPRVAGHVSYWFAWDSYLGAKSELYGSAK